MAIIESRKTEIRYKTSDPKRMLGKFLSERVLRTWKEDFVDEDTGNVVSIERSEIIADKGTYLDKEAIAGIQFWMQEGSVKEVEVSNQKRMCVVQKNMCMQPYKAKVTISGKNYTFLLYGTSIPNVLIILADYIELNYRGEFRVMDVKELDFCMVLIDTLKKKPSKKKGDDEEEDSEENENSLKFYQISARIQHRDKDSDDEYVETEHLFIVRSYTCVRANTLIENHLRAEDNKRYEESFNLGKQPYRRQEINSFIEESKTIPISCFIPMEFSNVYNDPNDN